MYVMKYNKATSEQTIMICRISLTQDNYVQAYVYLLLGNISILDFYNAQTEWIRRSLV